jgi:hypothetical protein
MIVIQNKTPFRHIPGSLELNAGAIIVLTTRYVPERRFVLDDDHTNESIVVYRWEYWKLLSAKNDMRTTELDLPGQRSHCE